jgi:hypothetical protein
MPVSVGLRQQCSVVDLAEAGFSWRILIAAFLV